MSDTRDIHVGTPAEDFRWDESVTVHFHTFESLSTVRSKPIFSPKFTCAGHEWKLVLYPGGHLLSPDGMIRVCLHNVSAVKIGVKVKTTLMKSSGGAYKIYVSPLFGLKNGHMRGLVNYVSRGDILDETNDILNKGTLTFVVRIKPSKGYYCQSIKNKTLPSLNDDIFNNLFPDESSADVAFNVRGKLFHAHQNILKARVPDFAELTEQFNKESPMLIYDVYPKIFELMLKYVYGKNMLTCQWREHAKEILVASGKYGFSSLRMMAEAWCIENLNLTVDSAVEELLYADGNHCLDLKKAVVEYIVENGKGVMESPSYAKLYETPELMKEVVLKLAESNESRKRKLDELSP